MVAGAPSQQARLVASSSAVPGLASAMGRLFAAVQHFDVAAGLVDAWQDLLGSCAASCSPAAGREGGGPEGAAAAWQGGGEEAGAAAGREGGGPLGAAAAQQADALAELWLAVVQRVADLVPAAAGPGAVQA